MDPTAVAFLRSWPFDPWVVVPLVVTAVLYLRGWLVLRRRAPWRFSGVQLTCFLGGLIALFLALASPIEVFSGLLLHIHMLQHLLLMMVAPPLLWLGSPLLPVLRGLPKPVRKEWAGPLLRSRFLRRLFAELTRLPVAWTAFVAMSFLWHLPWLYEAALNQPAWHYAEHVCFFGTALLFWWPVIQPYPARPGFSSWLLLPYLLLADVANTLLAAALTFSDRVLYAHYDAAPRLWGLSPLRDQALAGVLMWVPGSFAFLLPLIAIGYRLLFGETSPGIQLAIVAPRGRISLPLAPMALAPLSTRSNEPGRPRRRSWLNSFLAWRHARTVLQVPLLVLSLTVIADGLLGPDIASMNLAGVLPWIHWRGFLILGLLLMGNVFCMACPFVLPRRLLRPWRSARTGRAWPRVLRNKWLPILLLVVFFWAYEAFSLWASPWWTAWIAIGYFLGAFVVDVLFREGTFCKYVCPIGQFNFVQSLLSPLGVAIADRDVCNACRTKDCIRGREEVPGCTLALYLPAKKGNFDCTMCLDCVQACPSDNIRLAPSWPGSDLLHDPRRSGIGRLSRRTDIACLVLVLTSAAFTNAAGMVTPVLAWQDRIVEVLGLPSPLPLLTVAIPMALLVVPAFVMALAAMASQRLGREAADVWEIGCRYAYAFVPLGASMWLAHYSYHLLTSARAVVPVVQRAAGQIGFDGLGPPAWAFGCCATVAPWLPRLEILFLDCGLLLSLYVGYRIARDRLSRCGRVVLGFLPWGLILICLFACGVWIVLQPMEMRGTMVSPP